MKKVLSVVLSLVTVISILPIGIFEIKAHAIDEFYYEGNYYYTVHNNEAMIENFSDYSSESVIIPNKLGGYPVTSIGFDAFWDCTSLKSITIPDSVERIGPNAFSNCASLKSITIPNSVTSIGDYAFYSCDSLTSITIGDSVKSIGYSAFEYCRLLEKVNITDIAALCNISFYNDRANPLYYANNLYHNDKLVTDLVIPEGVTSISDYAFYNCTSLKGITIPDSVTSIGSFAFGGCDSLEKILYTGSEDEREKIIISDGNNGLTSANWHYNICKQGKHQYKSICSFKCENCEWQIENGHKFDNDDDLVCNRCNGSRKPPLPFAISYEYEDSNVLKVTYKNNLLIENTDYIIVYSDDNSLISIAGINEYDGIKITRKKEVVKETISCATVSVSDCTYSGYPLRPSVTVKIGDKVLNSDDYIVRYFNNTGVGIGTAVVIGKGKYTGYVEKDFTISKYDPQTTSKTFYSATNGSATIVGGKVTLSFDSIKSYSVKTASGNVIKSNSYSSPGGSIVNIDFSNISTGTYYLTYKIQGSALAPAQLGGGGNYYYYTGPVYEYTIMVNNTYVGYPTESKPKNIIANIPSEIDCRTLLLTVDSKTSDANLDGIKWSSNNDGVGIICDGVLSLKKAGEIVVTAELNDLTAKWEMDIKALDISSKGRVLGCDPNTSRAKVLYDGQLLQQDIDYVVKTETKGDCRIVTIQGINLFSGELIELVYSDTGNPYCAKSIELSKMPNKVDYLVNEKTIDLEGAEITVTLMDGSKILVHPNENMIFGFNDTKVAEQNVLLNCYGCQTSFKVSVKCATHSYGEYFSKDSVNHIRKCSICGVEEGSFHNYSKATCEKLATCTVCGETTGEKAEHKYSKATCEKLATCTVCGETTGEKAEHKYSKATCEKLATCTVCGKTTGEKDDHKYSHGCDEICNTCGAIRTALGHKYDNACDTRCNNCGEIRSVDGHNYKAQTVKATTSKNGYNGIVCSECGISWSKNTYYAAKTVKLSTTKYTYNGKTKKPTVTVKDSKGKTISSKYYTVTYASGRKNVGKYKVTVKFKGNYSGTKTLYFEINPGKTTVKKVSGAKKSVKVTITKKTTQVSGYQIQYSTSKKFTSAKTKTITSAKTTSATIKSLKAKKTYYVRVRTYKTVSGKKYYSGWSSYKSAKTK